ncbi:hypothetical protein H2200_003146 [Cladophialophora chaetospira]|uniref:Uncharacterized protein n=1 Tax=Cladophialophora chaetospira TaxID=386627 RepID=A0AA39CM02_9EURO|nr:hypothetical protein H2200_003146 [Cladophialophora chaetospira]
MSTSTPDEARKIPIPPSLTADTQELPSEMASKFLSFLRSDTNAIPELGAVLSDSLNRTGWTDRVRALALELLRNGTCDTFPELMAEVTRRATLPPKEPEKPVSNKDKSKETNGAATSGAGAVNGNNAIALSKEWSGGPDGLPDVRTPYVTAEKGVAFVRDLIEEHYGNEEAPAQARNNHETQNGQEEGSAEETNEDDTSEQEEIKQGTGWIYVDEDLMPAEPRHDEISADPKSWNNIMPQGSKRARKGDGTYREN